MKKMQKFVRILAMGGCLTMMMNMGSVVMAEEESFPYMTTPMEYTLYQNIFYNDLISQFEGQEMTKVGTFSTITDSFSDVTRYYVWGYNDETKCCDWQWEFVPGEDMELPPEGSLIEVTGTFTQDENALDSCWLTDVTMEVKTPWKESDVDVDMSTMSGTLERVQLINMQYYPEQYEGKSVLAYGRVESGNSVQHPYYDGAWSQEFSTEGEVPAIGTTVLVSGKYTDGIITEAEIAETKNY